VVWQFWGRAAEGVLSFTARDVFLCTKVSLSAPTTTAE